VNQEDLQGLEFGEFEALGEVNRLIEIEGMHCMVKVKEFETETDGLFVMVTIIHLDSDSQVTGNYAILKLKQEKTVVAKSPVPKNSSNSTPDNKAKEGVVVIKPALAKHLEVIKESLNEFSLGNSVKISTNKGDGSGEEAQIQKLD
jgi:hypothetical protein